MNAEFDPLLRDRVEQVFRGLLWRIGARPLAGAVDALVDEVIAASAEQSIDLAFGEAYRRTREQVLERLSSKAGQHKRLLEITIAPVPPRAGPDFQNDAGLGGLARWLRAAGYDAAFWPGIDDDDLLRKMTASGAILLTSDRRLMERGVITSGAIAALLVPVSLGKREQFAYVRAALELPLKAARCMACGGGLSPVDKASVRDRIPPRTYPWLDDYYLCQRCHKLFWEGTHWQRIKETLKTT